MIKFERLYLLTTGIIHGLTNLGGSLLSAIVFSKKISNCSIGQLILRNSRIIFAVFFPSVKDLGSLISLPSALITRSPRLKPHSSAGL